MPISRKSDGSIEVSPREELLRLCETTDDPATALNILQGQLAVATELAEGLGDHGRAGIFRAMVALLDYCSGQGIPRATLYPLQLVAGAIFDADKGVATPAFRPDRKPGRPTIPTFEITSRAHSAVVVECCIRHQRKEKVRACKVEGAKLARNLLRRASWNPDLGADQLAQLREEVSARPVGDPIRDEFDRMMDSEFVTAEPLAYAKSLIGHGWVNKPPAGSLS